MSRLAHDRAKRVMPGGNTRSSVYEAPFPLYLKSGNGAYVTDIDGNSYLDFQNNFTALIHGYSQADVTSALMAQVGRGLSFASPSESEIDLAEILCARVPFFEQVRFTNTGSEAVMMAIKAARAITGRPKIAKCEGAYHGNYDYVEASFDAVPANWEIGAPEAKPYNSGTPASVLAEVVVIAFNDIGATERVLERHKETLGCVIIDPLPSRAGLVPIDPSYLRFLREFTARHGILLISDEVLSFRLSYRGATAIYGIEPDLCVFGKIVGGGLPIGAIAGRAEIMRVFDPSRGKPLVSQAGTFTANPLSMVAGAAAMRALTEGAIVRLNALGAQARSELNAALATSELGGHVTGAGSLFCVFIGDRKVKDYASAYHAWQQKKRISQLISLCRDEGILLSRIGLGSLSTPMGTAEIATLAVRFGRALGRLAAATPSGALA
ncbi:MAG: aspartate aminotransferase family protein [Mesorhizobium sp.]|nr:MAG: aspartate aminotransferase family protein [Mesorhizobium sp.]RWN07752.1 MAG: aspartate aminotransferase family protein [Mesorhizobium sp.]RWN12492.1 MAG: aspartate aminotransferase family protein [Mesorhizobium sp.]TIQ97806.1 MAG: aspartate aminotransferase family protein [Mesorhizobium sp.]